MEIIISKPKIYERVKGMVCLESEVRYDSCKHPIRFEVPVEYGQYLCDERSDAFVIGMLNFAMRQGCDIVSEAPMTEELLFQLREYLIPSLAKYGHKMYATGINSESDNSPLLNAGAVGTGMSCGIDSLHVLYKHMPNSPFSGLRLTHLTLFNVGAYRGDSEQLKWQVSKAREVAAETGLKMLETNSNIATEFPRDHHLTHTYSNMFGVFALRKLWKTYFYGSSGMDYASFSIKDNELKDASFYELLSLASFSIPQLHIYSEGAALTKFEKTRDLLSFDVAQRHLHVCVADDGPNCSRCAKCRRQLVLLDALGGLDDFRNVFDVEGYMKNRTWYMRWLAWQKLNYHKDALIDEAYLRLKNTIPLKAWVEALTLYPLHSLWKKIVQGRSVQ